MEKMGYEQFFKILPLQLIQHDLNSLTYAQDSRSWLIPLIAQHQPADANLNFFLTHLLPLIMQLDKMRDLEKKSRNGSPIKIKKYETLIIQVWQLLPHFAQ